MANSLYNLLKKIGDNTYVRLGGAKKTFTYKYLNFPYTVKANETTHVSWDAATGGVSGYNAIGITRVITDPVVEVQISGWDLYYDGHGEIILGSNNKSEVSDGTLNICILYAAKGLFANYG